MGNLREQFPALSQKVLGQEWTYLDSAATSLKPQSVAKRVYSHLLMEASNVHRGAHAMAHAATLAFEEARELCKEFLTAESADEIIFTKGTTDGINLLASSLTELACIKGDEILLTELEHHSNIVPWQIAAKKQNLVIKYVKINSEGEIDLNDLMNQLTTKTKIVSISGCSNVLGTMPDLTKVSKFVKACGAYLVVDAAQLVSQRKIDIKNLDFLCFSSHKLFGPTGVGVLYGKKEILNRMPPYQSGGSMIEHVSLNESTYLNSPHRFEAGTPAIAEIIGFGESMKFLKEINFFETLKGEVDLCREATSGLLKRGAIVYGKKVPDTGIVSFNIPQIHHSDLAQVLNQQGVAVRSGHLCCQPLMKTLKISGCVRASFSIYNNESDLKRFIEALDKAVEILI